MPVRFLINTVVAVNFLQFPFELCLSSVSREVKRQIVTFVKFIIYPLATIAKNTFDTAPKQDLNSKLRRRIGTNYDLDRKRGLASPFSKTPRAGWLPTARNLLGMQSGRFSFRFRCKSGSLIAKN